MDESLETEIRDLLDAGNKIAAIKAYREATGASLAEAKQAIEDFETGSPLTLSETDFSELAGDILKLLEAGEPIQAIKVCRERTGMGLKQSKETIEQIARKAGLPSPFSGGCAGLLILAATAFGGMAAGLLMLFIERP